MAFDTIGTNHLTRPRPTITDLFRTYGLDKGDQPTEPWMWPMNYGPAYDALLGPLRDEPITLLELGYGEYDPVAKNHDNPDLGGRSARVWRDFFTQAQIHVADITPKNNIPDGVHFHCGSQADPEFLRSVYLQAGPFDVVIDDASHTSSLTVAAFKGAWPYLRPGGLYFVEDLHSSYADWYFGADEAHPNPGQHKVQTAMVFFKRLADEAFFNARHRGGPKVDGKKTTDWDCFPREYWMGYQVESVTFQRPQLIIVRKRLEQDYAAVPRQ